MCLCVLIVSYYMMLHDVLLIEVNCALLCELLRLWCLLCVCVCVTVCVCFKCVAVCSLLRIVGVRTYVCV